MQMCCTSSLHPLLLHPQARCIPVLVGALLLAVVLLVLCQPPAAAVTVLHAVPGKLSCRVAHYVSPPTGRPLHHHRRQRLAPVGGLVLKD
jgi:hypothetical protein